MLYLLCEKTSQDPQILQINRMNVQPLPPAQAQALSGHLPVGKDTLALPGACPDSDRGKLPDQKSERGEGVDMF